MTYDPTGNVSRLKFSTDCGVVKDLVRTEKPDMLNTETVKLLAIGSEKTTLKGPLKGLG